MNTEIKHLDIQVINQADHLDVMYSSNKHMTTTQDDKIKGDVLGIYKAISNQFTKEVRDNIQEIDFSIENRQLKVDILKKDGTHEIYDLEDLADQVPAVRVLEDDLLDAVEDLGKRSLRSKKLLDVHVMKKADHFDVVCSKPLSPKQNAIVSKNIEKLYEAVLPKLTSDLRDNLQEIDFSFNANNELKITVIKKDHGIKVFDEKELLPDGVESTGVKQVESEIFAVVDQIGANVMKEMSPSRGIFKRFAHYIQRVFAFYTTIQPAMQKSTKQFISKQVTEAQLKGIYINPITLFTTIKNQILAEHADYKGLFDEKELKLLFHNELVDAINSRNKEIFEGGKKTLIKDLQDKISEQKEISKTAPSVEINAKIAELKEKLEAANKKEFKPWNDSDFQKLDTLRILTFLQTHSDETHTRVFNTLHGMKPSDIPIRELSKIEVTEHNSKDLVKLLKNMGDTFFKEGKLNKINSEAPLKEVILQTDNAISFLNVLNNMQKELRDVKLESGETLQGHFEKLVDKSAQTTLKDFIIQRSQREFDLEDPALGRAHNVYKKTILSAFEDLIRSKLKKFEDIKWNDLTDKEKIDANKEINDAFKQIIDSLTLNDPTLMNKFVKQVRDNEARLRRIAPYSDERLETIFRNELEKIVVTEYKLLSPQLEKIRQERGEAQQNNEQIVTLRNLQILEDELGRRKENVANPSVVLPAFDLPIALADQQMKDAALQAYLNEIEKTTTAIRAEIKDLEAAANIPASVLKKTRGQRLEDLKKARADAKKDIPVKQALLVANQKILNAKKNNDKAQLNALLSKITHIHIPAQQMDIPSIEKIHLDKIALTFDSLRNQLSQMLKSKEEGNFIDFAVRDKLVRDIKEIENIYKRMETYKEDKEAIPGLEKKIESLSKQLNGQFSKWFDKFLTDSQDGSRDEIQKMTDQVSAKTNSLRDTPVKLPEFSMPINLLDKNTRDKAVSKYLVRLDQSLTSLKNEKTALQARHDEISDSIKKSFVQGKRIISGHKLDELNEERKVIEARIKNVLEPKIEENTSIFHAIKTTPKTEFNRMLSKVVPRIPLESTTMIFQDIKQGDVENFTHSYKMLKKDIENLKMKGTDLTLDEMQQLQDMQNNYQEMGNTLNHIQSLNKEKGELKEVRAAIETKLSNLEQQVEERSKVFEVETTAEGDVTQGINQLWEKVLTYTFKTSKLDQLPADAKLDDDLKMQIRDYVRVKARFQKLFSTQNEGTKRLQSVIKKLEDELFQDDIRAYLKDVSQINNLDFVDLLYGDDVLRNVKASDQNYTSFTSNQQANMLFLNRIFTKMVQKQGITEDEKSRLKTVLAEIREDKSFKQHIDRFYNTGEPAAQSLLNYLPKFTHNIVKKRFMPELVKLDAARPELQGGMIRTGRKFIKAYLATYKNIKDLDLTEKLNTKGAALLEKLKTPEGIASIRKEDKLTLKELGTLSRSERLSKSGFVKDLEAIGVLDKDPLLNKWVENHKKSKEILTHFEKVIMNPAAKKHYKDGCILAHTVSKRKEWTGRPPSIDETMVGFVSNGFTHGAKLYHNTKGEVTLSHIQGEYEQDELNLYELCISDIWEVDVAPLVIDPNLKETLMEIYPEGWEKAVNEMYQKIEKDIHTKGEKAFDKISNDAERRIKAGLSNRPWLFQVLTKKGIKAHERTLKRDFNKIHKKMLGNFPLQEEQICSEFVSKVTATSMIEVNKRLTKLIIEKTHISPEVTLSKLEAAHVKMEPDVKEYLQGKRYFRKEALRTEKAEKALIQLLKARKYSDEDINLIIRIGNEDILDLPYKKESMKSIHPGRMSELLVKRGCARLLPAPPEMEQIIDFEVPEKTKKVKALSDREIIKLQGMLTNLINKGDVYKVNKMLKVFPDLRNSKEISQGEHANEGLYISLSLPMVIERGDIQMVKCLIDNGAKLDAFSRGNKSSVDIALNSGNNEMVKYLLERGAKPSFSTFYGYAMKKNFDLDTGLMLAKTFDKISSDGVTWSTLAIVGTRKENLDTVKELLKLLIEKGDRLKEADKEFEMSQEIKDFIDEQIKLVTEK
ncbi:MAG: hypothetical protein H0W88_07030 [Parachlamydiaceae bacterium]|nr:hypothetical protein [Parachlamydiaceae bacterium]